MDSQLRMAVDEEHGPRRSGEVTCLRSRWALIAAVVVACLGGSSVLTSSAAAPAGASAFVAITPCRPMDARAVGTVGPRNAPSGAGEMCRVSVWG